LLLLQFTHLLPCSIGVQDIDHLDQDDLLFFLETQPAPRDLPRICLCYADLSKQALPKTNLSEAIIVGTTLNGADLSNSDLSRTQILFSSLNGVDMRDVIMEGGTRFVSCVMTRINLTGLNLVDIRLKHVDLTGAIMCGANLAGADFSGFFLEHVNFTGSNLEGAILRGAHLKGAMFNDCNLRGAVLEAADAPGVDFAGSDMRQAVFDGANLCGANFMPWLPAFVSSGDGTLRIALNQKKELHLAGASFRECCLDEAIFDLSSEGAMLYWGQMAYRYLSTSKPRFDLTMPGRAIGSLLDAPTPLKSFLNEVQYTLSVFEDEDASNRTGETGDGMSGICLSGSSLVGAHFADALLADCDFDYCDLRRARLEGADLSHASFKGALLQAQRLERCDLTKTILDEANLTNADLTGVLANTELSASFESAVCVRARLRVPLQDMLQASKVAVMNKPANSQFLDGSPLIKSRPATAVTRGQSTSSGGISKAWSRNGDSSAPVSPSGVALGLFTSPKKDQEDQWQEPSGSLDPAVTSRW